MPILIRDPHLEQQIDQERQRRGDGSMAKTLVDLARERLTELATAELYQGRNKTDPDEPAESPDAGQKSANV